MIVLQQRRQDSSSGGSTALAHLQLLLQVVQGQVCGLLELGLGELAELPGGAARGQRASLSQQAGYGA